MDLKQKHEAFVSNNNGTTLFNISLITLTPSLSLFICLLSSACLSSCAFVHRPSVEFVFQFILLVIPSLLCTTVFSSYLIHFTIFLFLTIISLIHLNKNICGPKLEKLPQQTTKNFQDKTDESQNFATNFSISTIPSKTSTTNTSPKTPTTSSSRTPTTTTSTPKTTHISDPPPPNWRHRPSFITSMRGMVLLQTSISILAIDFPLCPRSFGKTELTGYGLMDVGTGLFIVCNSIIHPSTRLPPTPGTFKDLLKAIASSIFSSWPLLFCFSVRLISLKQLDYHEHTSEYGIHWNFFLTLACLKIISATTTTIFSLRTNFFIAIFINVTYEILLELYSFKHYVLSSGPRITIVDMNKEGIYSLPGSFCIYIYSLVLGRLIHQHLLSSKQSLLRWKWSFLVKLTILSLSLWCCLGVYAGGLGQLETLFGGVGGVFGRSLGGVLCGFEVSRRLTNLGYVLWVLALGTTALSSLLLVEVLLVACLGEEPSTGFEPLLLRAITYNSFMFFLLANLLTGVVNISVDTTTITSTFFTMVVMVAYLGVLNGVFVVLFRKKVKIKFW